VPLIKGALAHQGAAFIDVVSPCVTFNNHAGSTKSYDYVREHNEAVSRIDFIALGAEITASPAPGETIDLPQPDGSIMRLRKLHADHDPTDRVAAMNQHQSVPSAWCGHKKSWDPAFDWCAFLANNILLVSASSWL
jgi:2-oxoglutarate ferredoxin oxidoreductase subunit beta